MAGERRARWSWFSSWIRKRGIGITALDAMEAPKSAVSTVNVLGVSLAGTHWAGHATLRYTDKWVSKQALVNQGIHHQNRLLSK